MVIGLIFIFFLVLVLPLSVRFVENNLEMFLFVMGLFAALVGGVFNGALFIEAVIDPIDITVAVFFAGLIFKWFQGPLENAILKMSQVIPFRGFIALATIFLGIVSSAITAIIAALLLVLIVTSLQLERKAMVRFVVLACFSIGIGAALSPIGEPLATIAVNKLDEDFFFLFQIIGIDVFLAILLFGVLAGMLVSPPTILRKGLCDNRIDESYEEIFVRALKIYFFVMGLTMLGAGFKPLIDQYVVQLQPAELYWLNTLSAVLDNATLAAAEISPAMSHMTVQAILLGLLISGGMLIPGNIPNIIAAGRLKITSKEWAKVGVPIGLVMMIFYFFLRFWLV